MRKILNIECGLTDLLRKEKGCSFFASQSKPSITNLVMGTPQVWYCCDGGIN